MLIDFTAISPRNAYQWMTSTIMPRPIAWVSTVSPDGRTNLAPFSFFQGITGNPPTLMFVPVNNRDGNKKDTLRNIELTREFVVNLVPHAMAAKMNDTAANLPYGESEFAKFGLRELPSGKVKAPRVEGAPVSFECRMDQIVSIGQGPLAANVVFGRILALHVADDVIGPGGLPDHAKLDLVGRMGGEDYTTTRDTFNLVRPD
jgi:flavin reductase (DIM6/NTAB) family NADH-FMN oxidoreductase RutF